MPCFSGGSGKIRLRHKDIDRASNLYGDYVDPSGHVVIRNLNIKLDPQPAVTTFGWAPMSCFLSIQGGIGMHVGFARVFRHHMAVFGCRSEWQSDFSRMRLS